MARRLRWWGNGNANGRQVGHTNWCWKRWRRGGYAFQRKQRRVEKWRVKKQGWQSFMDRFVRLWRWERRMLEEVGGRSYRRIVGERRRWMKSSIWVELYGNGKRIGCGECGENEELVIGERLRSREQLEMRRRWVGGMGNWTATLNPQQLITL